MLSPTIYRWIALVLLLALVITGIIIYDTYDDLAEAPTIKDDQKRILTSIQLNKNSDPISDILFFQGSKCPTDYEPLYLTSYPGIQDACDCGKGIDGLTVGLCQASQTSCTSYPGIQGGTNLGLKKWFQDYMLCGKRQKLQIANSAGECPQGMKKCSKSFCVENKAEILCPIHDLLIQNDPNTAVAPENYEKVQVFENTRDTNGKAKTFYVSRGNPTYALDNFLHLVAAGFNGSPCLDPFRRFKRNNNLNGKIDYPELYNGCGTYGADTKSSIIVDTLAEPDFLANNVLWLTLPATYKSIITPNADTYNLYNRQNLLTNLEADFCKTVNIGDADKDITQRRKEILDLFDDAFLVLLIGGIVTLIVVAALIALAAKPIGKILALTAMVLLLTISIWWIVTSYEIDDLQEQNSVYQTFLDKNCISDPNYQNFLKTINSDIQGQLDYFDDEENALCIVGYIVAILALLAGLLTAIHKGGPRTKEEATTKDERYQQLQNDKIARDKIY